MNCLGIDIGGTYIKYAIVDESNNIIKQWKKETIKFNTAQLFYDYLCEDIEINNIKCIGVSSPGVIAEDSTVLSEAAENIRVMYLTNVNNEVYKRLGIPVYTINDAKAAGYCEFMIGNSKNSKSSAYFIIGTGIGGCLCDDKGVIQGLDRLAGEFSNIPIGYEKGTNKIVGLWEIASMTGLITIYNNKVDNKLRYGKEICDLYLLGDIKAEQSLREWCKNIILGLYTIIFIYNPEIICVGGGISEEKWFIDMLLDMYEQEIEFVSKPPITTKITKCKFNNDANVLGAILFAMHQSI